MQCPQCHTPFPDGARFCAQCGYGFDSEAGQKVEGHGERKQVTVLFSDLSGYTAMTEKLDPEEAQEVVGRIFDAVSAIITKFEGTIEKFVGDAVMAVFGVPCAHEDDPLRAIRAAREIHETVRDYSPLLQSRIGRPLAMHSGIATGLVITGGTPRTGTQGLVGDTINLAARLQGLARSDEILVGEETCRLACSHFIFQTIDPTPVKGKAEPVAAYKVLSAVPESAVAARLQGVRAEFIGREEPMAQLTEAVQRLHAGEGSIISIVGNAGTGKSRLVKEFKQTLDLNRIQWREGHAYPYTRNTPYYPLINLLTHAFQIQEGDTPDAIRAKIAEGINALLWNRPDIIPYVGGLFSLRYPETEHLSPEFRREALKKAVAEILEALARRAPTILWFEDLHWADNAFLQLLHQLMTHTRQPLLFILVYRPVFTLFGERVPDHLAWPCRTIALHDLDAEHSRRMLASLLKADQIPSELENFVLARVEGNPFFLEEVINSLIESRLLIQEKGRWRLTGPISQAVVPTTVQGVLTARLDRLASESKRILQEAAVIGRAFYFEVLKRISELAPRLPACLTDLEKLDLIRARSLAPDLEYIFKHALTQEVVYNGMLKKERKALHERIAAVMETLFSDRLPEFYEALAHHYQRGESIDKAIDYWIKSGDKAQNQFCLQEAYHAYQSAYELLKSKAELTPQEKHTLIDLLIAWAWVAYLMADFRIVQPLLHAYLPMAEHLGDRGRYGMLLAWYGWSIQMREGDQRGLTPLHQALAIAEEIQDKRLAAYCCTWLSWVYIFSDLKFQHPHFVERSLRLADELGTDLYLNHKALAGLAYGSHWSGLWKQGVAAGEKAVADGRKASHLRGMAIGYLGISSGQIAAGQLAKSIEFAEMALAQATDPLYEQMAKLAMGLAYIESGELKKAQEMLVPVDTYLVQSGCRLLGGGCSAALGILAVMSGRLREGLDRLETEREYCEKVGSKTTVVAYDFLKGLVFAQLAFPTQKPSAAAIYHNLRFLLKHLPRAAHTAEKCFHSAIALGNQVGAYQFVALSHLELGKLFLARKKPQKARAQLQEARRIFTELENDFYLGRTEACLAEVDG